jgi:mannose-1-phosphate guanylyltransferase
MRNSSNAASRWGIVLAGGDGVRLRPLTSLISGDDRPKQFCALYGGRTLLEQARRRAEQSVRAEQILFSLNRAHERFYIQSLADCPTQRVVQPTNRGTAAAILSSLLLIARKDHNATIAIFPSDHYYSDENVIGEAVENAFEMSRREPDNIVLVGARPHGAELEYGWIEVDEPVPNMSGAFRVRSFFEKPSLPLAHLLLSRGAFWNTFVLVGTAFAFLEIICSAMPGLLKEFQRFPALPSRGKEVRIEDSLYERIASGDFSRQVLATETGRLIVQQLGPVMWSDLGDGDRAVAALSGNGMEPAWAESWRAAKPPASVTRPVTLSALA